MQTNQRDRDEIDNFLDSPLQMDFPVKHISPTEVHQEIKKLNKKSHLDMIV